MNAPEVLDAFQRGLEPEGRCVGFCMSADTLRFRYIPAGHDKAYDFDAAEGARHSRDPLRAAYEAGLMAGSLVKSWREHLNQQAADLGET
jgi:hypothetical protein